MNQLADELRAAAAARSELGRDYEPAVLDAFVERLGRAIDQRVDARMPARRGGDFLALVLALGSIGMALGVPGAMSGSFGDAATFVLTLVAWAAIAAINVAFIRRRR